MKVSERLFSGVEDIWDTYNRHPFVKELAAGTLPIEKFRFYMIGDQTVWTCKPVKIARNIIANTII